MWLLSLNPALITLVYDLVKTNSTYTTAPHEFRVHTRSRVIQVRKCPRLDGQAMGGGGEGWDWARMLAT